MVRAPLPEDLQSIAELYHHVWHEAEAGFAPEETRSRRTLSYFVERIQPLISTMLIAEATDGLAGFVSRRENYVGQLYVRGPYRGSAYAIDLLAAAERAMAAAGTLEAELHCYVGNHRAHRFYIRNGWHDDVVITKPMAAAGGFVDIPSWRMCKRL
jgi:GNAT superfamily N-acetyltransferase